MMRQKLQHYRQHTWYPFMLFCAAVFAFTLIATHLFLKMDDGHFLGILHNPGFTLQAWLAERYQTVSGRTVMEAFMMTFLRLPPVFWQLATALLLCYIVWFFAKIAVQCSGTMPNRAKIAFACCIPFLILVTCLNASVFWFAGSFTFLWPFAFLLITISPLVFTAADIPFHKALYVGAFLAAPVATSQEQAAAATLAFLGILLLILLRQKKFHWYQTAMLLPAVLGSYHLFSSPGMAGRLAMESTHFPAFLEMGVLEKLLCGLTNFFGFSFFQSIPTIAAFLALLLGVLYAKNRQHPRTKSLLIAQAAYALLVFLGVNIVYTVTQGASPRNGFSKAFLTGSWGKAETTVTLLCCGLLLLLALDILWLWKQNSRLSISVGLCFAAAVCCALVMGFSSSIYVSGQRVFFFTEIFLWLGSVLLFASLPKNAFAKVMYRICVAAAICLYLFEWINFSLLEIPVMG